MSWFFSGLLVAVSGGVVVFTAYLVRRLFTSGPAPVESVGTDPGSAADRSAAAEREVAP